MIVMVNWTKILSVLYDEMTDREEIIFVVTDLLLRVWVKSAMTETMSMVMGVPAIVR